MCVIQITEHHKHANLNKIQLAELLIIELDLIL